MGPQEGRKLREGIGREGEEGRKWEGRGREGRERREREGGGEGGRELDPPGDPNPATPLRKADREEIVTVSNELHEELN